MNDFGSLKYCQDCEEWVEACEHFQHESKNWVSLTWTIKNEQPVDMIDNEQPEVETKRPWWRFGL